ncbi:MAG: ATP-binding cassette domain-containing protein [Verrucomicrobiales bacterium]|nr:ATP-binding cassette domain-containing protein [Verrucomicrobiales bacterium]
MAEKPEEPLIEVTDLTVEGASGIDSRSIRLRSVSLSVERGEIVVLGGEAGSGKSLLCECICGIMRRHLRVTNGSVRVGDRDAMARGSARLASQVSFLEREPKSAFNPHHTVERSLREFTRLLARVAKQPKDLDWNDAFYAVGIVEPERVLSLVIDDLPLMMLQRLALMRALMSSSKVIVCDEATISLDRVAESQFIDLITQIREERDITFVLAMGRLRNAERFADRIVMFFEGGILESGAASDLVSKPSCRYTAEFLETSPKLTHSPHALPTISLEAITEAEEIIHGSDRTLQLPEAD